MSTTRQLIFYLKTRSPIKDFPHKGNISFRVSQKLYEEICKVQERLIETEKKIPSWAPLVSRGVLEEVSNWQPNYEIVITNDKIHLYEWNDDGSAYHVYEHIK